MKLNKKIILASILMLIVLLYTSTVHAAIQSSGETAAQYNMDTWIKSIRQMESVGGGFGLSETINSNLTSSSGSNNIDVHMEKNTEYGAMAILSASSYGNPNKIEDGQTTTGNETGIVMKINQEWVAAGTISLSSIYKNVANKYKNIETETYKKRNGDAIEETKAWHGGNNLSWIAANGYATSGNTISGLLRAYSESIFSYYGNGRYSGSGAYAQPNMLAGYLAPHPTRCVVITGEGI